MHITLGLLQGWLDIGAIGHFIAVVLHLGWTFSLGLLFVNLYFYIFNQQRFRADTATIPALQASPARCAKFQTSISLPMKIIEKAKILLEEYKFEELSKLLQNKSKKEVETLLFTIAYDDECLLVYTFINSLIQKHETAALHYLASHIMAFALNQLPNGYKIAYYHALKALELSPNDIELKNYILLFYSIPDKLLSREVALDYAKEVYDNDKNNNAARQVLELPLVSNK